MALTRTFLKDDFHPSDPGFGSIVMRSTGMTAANAMASGCRTAMASSVIAGALVFAGVMFGASGAAYADLRVCNKTTSRIGIAVGYKDQDAWTSEGWWNLPASSCETLLAGALVSQYYYLYAIDYDRGGEWSGRYYLCTQEKTFTIKGYEDCIKRGYERTGFFEINTGDQRNWTVQLTEPGRSTPAPQQQPQN